MSAPLDRLVCVVTGSSGGIGSAIAAELHRRGGRVIGCDLAPPATDTAHSTDLERFCALDATDEEAVAATLDDVEGWYGGIDIVVHAVGILGDTADPLRTSTTEWDRVMRVNAASAFTVVREAAVRMRPRRCGAIVLVSSVAAKEARREYLPYDASKVALLSLTWSMALVLGPDLITVNAVCPGPVNTPMWTQKASALGGDADGAAQSRAERAAQIPLGRFAEPVEVARTVAFLVDPANRYLTGLSLDVAGGAHLGMGT